MTEVMVATENTAHSLVPMLRQSLDMVRSSEDWKRHRRSIDAIAGFANCGSNPISGEVLSVSKEKENQVGSRALVSAYPSNGAPRTNTSTFG